MKTENSIRGQRRCWAIISYISGVFTLPAYILLAMESFFAAACVLYVAGLITGIVSGAIALRQIRREPTHYGGRSLAKAGVIASGIFLPLIGVSAAITSPAVLVDVELGREAGAIMTLRTIHNSQIQFKETNHRFGSLEDLAAAELIDRNYTTGIATGGYTYSLSDISGKTYCVQATRISGNIAHRDFAICEDGIIRLSESKTPASIKRGEGVPITGTVNPMPTMPPNP
jgi:hypothetical protein